MKNTRFALSMIVIAIATFSQFAVASNYYMIYPISRIVQRSTEQGANGQVNNAQLEVTSNGKTYILAWYGVGAYPQVFQNVMTAPAGNGLEELYITCSAPVSALDGVSSFNLWDSTVPANVIAAERAGYNNSCYINTVIYGD